MPQSAFRIPGMPDTAYYLADFITPEEEQRLLEKIYAAPKPKWKQLSHRRLQAWPAELVHGRLLSGQALPVWLDKPMVDRLSRLTLDPASTQDVSHESADQDSIPVQTADPQNAGNVPTGPTNVHEAKPPPSSSPSSSTLPRPSHIFSDSPHRRPNHVLINEYPPGVGIMPHKDGPAYHPVVCTVSLGSSLCLEVHEATAEGLVRAEPTWRILQEPRSLLITTDRLYTDYFHGIADVEKDARLGPETVANWSLLRNTEWTDGVHVRETRVSLTYRDVLKVSKLGGLR